MEKRALSSQAFAPSLSADPGRDLDVPTHSQKTRISGAPSFLSPPVVAVVIFLLVFVSVAAVGAAPAQTAPTWRYDLRPGDHLIYRYTFQRRLQSDEEQTQVEARFRTHVLVAAEPAGRISLGFQRNREAAELTEYRSKGKDRLAREQPGFQKRMQARPSRFAEAMEISPGGEPLYPWEIARESYSHILDVLHEVLNLPPLPLAKGEAWRSPSLPQLEFRWVGDESIHGKMCRHVEATVPDKSLKLSYWWSPESGVLEQVALEGNYTNFDTVAHETARMELESRARGEQLATWLDSAETRQGALQAILLTPEVAVSAEQLAPVLGSGEPASQALVLAVASNRKIDVASGVLATLRQSASARVRLMAEAWFDSGHSHELTDECHRTLPPRPPPTKFGTVLEVARASTTEDGAIPYLLRVPLTYREDRPAPLMVYLSGGAGFAIDGVNSGENIVSETDYLVLYPQAAGYWWTPEVARRLDSVLHDVFERYNVDRDRIYLTGFSNGGTGALYFATLWPQRFAAVVSLMGAGQCNEAVKAGLPNLTNLPLLFVHGENDPRITPDCSTTTYAALTDLRPAIKPEMKILPHRAHDITLDSDDGLTLAFFKNKLRDPFPREVNLTLSDSLAARGYWVEILDGKPGKSSVEARVKADNTVEIHSHDVKRLRLHLRPELLPSPGDMRIIWNGKKMFSGPLRDVCTLPVLPHAGDAKLDLAETRDLELP
jgi:pimeloyl-ACP methyl ester carboxylesterase